LSHPPEWALSPGESHVSEELLGRFMEDKHVIEAQQVAAAVPVRKAHQIGLA
jgi:hypothetical protein